MSKLPKPPFEFNLSRKRNVQPFASKSTTSVNTTFTTTSNSSHNEDNDDSPRIGDRVLVDGKQLYGTLRFLGPTEFKSGVWAGVELDHQGTGKNDGSVQGISYFTCAPNTGIFVLSSKVALVTRNSVLKKKNRTLSSSLSSLSFSTTSSPSTPGPPTPPSHSSYLKKQFMNKNSQRTVLFNNVAPSPSVVEYEHVPVRTSSAQPPPPPPSSQLRTSINQYHSFESQRQEMMEQQRVAEEQHRKEIGDYQVKLGREQHRVYELRKEREQLVQQLQQNEQLLGQQQQMAKQWQHSQNLVQQLQNENHQQKATIDRLNNALELAQASYLQETTQLLAQQSQLIQELQRERNSHDAIKTSMKHVEQACQGIMDPFDVRPGLSLVDQLKETQRQVKDLLERVRQDTDQKHQQQRGINALHRDVASLESLIETKSLKEADLMESLVLERQFNRQLQDELKQVKQMRRKSTKSMKSNKACKKLQRRQHPALSMDSGVMMSLTDPRWTIGSGETVTTCSSSLSDALIDDDDIPAYCEICETVGHDLMTCLFVVTEDSGQNTKFAMTTHMDSTPIVQHKMLPSL